LKHSVSKFSTLQKREKSKEIKNVQNALLKHKSSSGFPDPENGSETKEK
jgi:hypothetical protein